MLFNKNVQRSLEGFLYHNMIAAAPTFYITAVIIAAAIIVNSLRLIIFSIFNINSENHISSITSGLGVSLVLLIIAGINAASGKTLKSNFVFPINREVYSLGNFVSLLYVTFGLLIIVSVGQVFELLIIKMIEQIFNNIVVENLLTVETYLKGFFLTFSYLIAISSLAYFIAAFCFKYKLPAGIAIAVAIGAAFMFGSGRNAMYQATAYFIGEQSIVFLGLKLWLASIILQLLAYIAFRKVEVNA